jgi:hypothetical protein
MGWTIHILNSGGGQDFSVSKSCRPALRLMQRAVQWLLGTLSVEVKWAGCGADCSPPSNVKVKNEWSCTSTSTVSLHGVYRKKCLQHLLQYEVFWVNCKLFRLYRQHMFTCLYAGTVFSECLNNKVKFILLFECILAYTVNVLQCSAVLCAVPAAQAVFNCISGWCSVQQTSILLMVSSITYNCYLYITVPTRAVHHWSCGMCLTPLWMNKWMNDSTLSPLYGSLLKLHKSWPWNPSEVPRRVKLLGEAWVRFVK